MFCARHEGLSSERTQQDNHEARTTEATPSPSPPFPIVHGEDSLMGSQIDSVSYLSHCEQNSFEFQIQEIDMELNKFDHVVEVNSKAKVQEFDSYSKTIPKEVDQGEFVGELTLDNLRPLDIPTPDFTPSTSP
nr:hypothetical protein CFP56_59028 [Quercus suber]